MDNTKFFLHLIGSTLKWGSERTQIKGGETFHINIRKPPLDLGGQLR